MATLYDVSEKCGLSIATVSRVINRNGLIKKATRERVLQAIEELNYRPKHAARMMAGRKTGTLGVVLPLSDKGSYVQILRGIDVVSTKENLKLLTFFYDNEQHLQEILSSLAGGSRTDGIILAHNTFLPPEKVRQLVGETLPVTFIGQPSGSTKAIDAVLIDDVRGAYCAVEYLLKQKPASILLLTGPPDNHNSKERLKGAQQAIRDALCAVEVSILHGDFHHEGGRRIFAEHISEQGTFPEAVFAFNDAMALGVLDVLYGTSIQVPEDMQIIGFDDKAIAQYAGLSTVRVPTQQIGEEAARLVVERIRGKHALPTSVILGTQLVARETTAGRMHKGKDLMWVEEVMDEI